MLNPHATNFIIMLDLVLLGEITHLLCLLGGFYVFIRREMVRYQDNLIVVKYSRTCVANNLVKRFNRYWRGDVIR